MNTADTYPRLVESLGGLRRQWRLYQVGEGVCLLAAGALVALLTLVIADNLLHLEKPARLGLALVLWLGILAAVGGLVVRRLLVDRRDDFFAALVERKHPELHNGLINALQLGRAAPNGFSPQLVQAIVRDAVDATTDLDLARSADGRPARRAALFALAALLALGGYATALTPRFTNGLARILLPLSDEPAYTATRIVEDSVEPTEGRNRFPEGDRVVIRARVAGVVPAVATLHRRTAQGRVVETRMEPEAGTADVFACTLPQIAESFDFHITAGDGRSRGRRVEVVRRPQTASITLTYQPPAYTELPSRQSTGTAGDIAGLLGTAVQFELKATKPLHEARLATEAGDAVNLARTDDDTVWRGAFVLWRRDLPLPADLAGRLPLFAPTRYQVKLTDVDGYANDDPLWRSVAVVADQPPTVKIARPGQDVVVKPDAAVPLLVEARDDHGVAEVQVRFAVNNPKEEAFQTLRTLPFPGAQPRVSAAFDWSLAELRLKPGDRVFYQATAADRNHLTGPGRARSPVFTLAVETAGSLGDKLDDKSQQYAERLQKLILLQGQNRAETASNLAFEGLARRQTTIRTATRLLARAMEGDTLVLAPYVKVLDELHAGPMAEAARLLESGRDAADAAKAADFRGRSLPVQDRILAELKALLDRMQKNEKAREELRRLEQKDKPVHREVTKVIGQLAKDLDKLYQDQTELAAKFERLPKKPVDELKEQALQATKDLEEFRKKWEKWQKESVNEMTKLPQGFVDDFGMRKDVNRVFEEIEKAANRSKAEKLEVSLEDLGAALATRMKEDLEMWMMDAPDAVKWVLEEPLNKKNMQIPEMPLPKALEDLVGELLQKAEEFDEEADDVTSAWGDNLDQAGWGVSDGPISTFSAKGKTGNDQPNNMEVTGRSGDGRRGKSAGQMVGDTARALPGRKTPARVGDERYEPGQLKQEGSQDPNGATGGGKVAGAGRKGLQGGSPPPLDLKRDMERLGEKQAGIREKAEQVAKKLEAVGANTRRLEGSIELMKSAEQDLRELRYDDAARKRRTALGQMKSALGGIDQATARQLHQARDLPPQLRKELLQGAEEGYPAGYESMLKSYYKALSQAEK